MSKLELKHIAPYFPYGLKCKFESEDFNHLIVGIEDTIDGVSLISPFNDYGKTDISKVKLILRPLSDLTKEIEHNGEKFVPLRELEDLFPCVEFYNDDELYYLFSDIDCMGVLFHSIELNLTLEISSKLFEWHFDVFNLLENGLAIDINTI